MGKDLHPSIMPYILKSLRSHQSIKSINDISNDENYIYRLTRNNDMGDVVVLISDVYHYSEFDYFSKPSELNAGGFILIAKPESDFPVDVQDHMIEEKVIIGKLGILLGALRINEFWTYEKPKPKK